MKEYYQSVRVSNDGTNEHVLYSGHNRLMALMQTTYHSGYDYMSHTETREYTLPDERDFEELSDQEQCNVLSCYNVID